LSWYTQRMSQLERIVYINRIIEEQGGVETSQIVDEFSISRRQVIRDVQYIKDRLNAPIVYSTEKKWYHYSESFTLFSNSNERLLVLNAIFRSLAQSQGMMGALTEMISEGLDSGVEKHYRSLSDKIVFISPVQDWPNYEVFTVICSAMKSGQRITMHYKNTKGVQSVRHIEPLRLVNYSGRWYLLAFDMKSKQLRTFHLSRIESLAEIQGDRIVKRYEEEQIDSFIHSGYGIFMGNEQTYVTFRVYDWAIEILKTQIWHRDQVQQLITEQGRKALQVTLPVASLNEIVSALLFFGPVARPVSPAAFVNMYYEAVENMQKQSDSPIQ